MGTTSKALSLLNLFSRTTPEIGLSEISRRSGINKATAFRLMTEMAEHGFVEQVGHAREYRLGPAFLRLAALREHNVPLKELAYEVLSEVADSTGETAHMSLLQGDALVTFSYAYSQAHGTSVRMEDAEILTFHGTSSGLAVLAFSSAEFVDEKLSAPLQKRTAHTITDPDSIRDMLPSIRSSGIAISIGGYEDDVFSHAVPVFDAKTNCIGAIAVAAPVSRMSEDHQHKIRHELLVQGCRLTRRIGGFLPNGFPENTNPDIEPLNNIQPAQTSAGA